MIFGLIILIGFTFRVTGIATGAACFFDLGTSLMVDTLDVLSFFTCGAVLMGGNVS